MQGYTFLIDTVSFEGPLDLLLTLIEKRKLHVNDISLATIALEYQEYCMQLEESDPYEFSDFLRILSSLLLIKSRALLPTLEFSKEEESDMSMLEERLKLYEYIRSLSPIIQEALEKGSSFSQLKGLYRSIRVFCPPQSLTTSNVHNSLLEFLSEKDGEILSVAKVTKVVSLKEVISSVHKSITRALKARFFELTQHITNSKEKVVYFLAILELSKQGLVDLEQDTAFGDIHIQLQSLETPRYGHN